MIYQIRGNYYVKVGSKYVRLEMKLDKNGAITMKPTKEKIESHKDLIVKPIDFAKEKDRIARSLRVKSYSDENS